MGSQFHTPSFGDEVFDLSGMDDTSASSAAQVSKRMQDMDNVVKYNANANANVGFGALQNNFAAAPQTPQIMPTPRTLAQRKQLTNEFNDSSQKNQLEPPAKPLSAYAYFFRDTVSKIKQQNPDCTFEQLSSIVKSMWDVSDGAQKDFYNRKTEEARIEYINQMKLYQQNLEAIQKQQQQQQQQLEQQQNQIANNENATVNNANKSLQQTQQPVSAENASIVNQTAPTTQTQSEVVDLINTNNKQELCIRKGCMNAAVMNPDWEDEYCSNECVVIHCRNVFNSWVQQNKEAAAASVTATPATPQ